VSILSAIFPEAPGTPHQAAKATIMVKIQDPIRRRRSLPGWGLLLMLLPTLPAGAHGVEAAMAQVLQTQG
jgi:hypothetical protein